MSTDEIPPASRRLSIRDKDGLRGWIDAGALETSAESGQQVWAYIDDGRAFAVPRELLADMMFGGYTIAVRFADLPVRGQASIPSPSDDGAIIVDASADPVIAPDRPLVIPVIAENLTVSKRPVVVGRVRLTKRVQIHDESVDETVQVARTHVERIPINRIVDAAPAVRYEGDTMVISVVEEVIVVETRLMLREELRVTTQRSDQHFHEQVKRRAEEITVERFDAQGQKTWSDPE